MANQVDTEQDVWVPYLGVNKPNVGKKIGWRNVATDEIRYQLDRPGESAPNETDKEDYTDFEVESFALDALPDMARRYAVEEKGGWETMRRANAIVDAMESAVIYASGDAIAATSKAYTDAVVGSIPKEELEEREEIAKRIPKNGICVSPKGAPSNLSREDWITVRTKKFKQWFGDWEKHGGKNTLWSDGDVSKAVDANGEPMLVYHGTARGGFGTFENSKVGTQHAGFFFTTDRAVASTYAGTLESAVIHAPLPGFPLVDYLDEETDWGIYSCFLNIRDVREHDFEGANWDGQKLPEEGTDEPVEYLGNSTWDASKEAEKFGADGCIIRNVIDIGPNYRSSADKASDIFVVFMAGNIKLATAKSFDSKNVDIRMSTWVKYKGPRGGEGWRNTATDEVRYQAEMPGAEGERTSVPEVSRQSAKKTFWHLTEDPRFTLKNDFVPAENAISLSYDDKPGLFLTDNPEYWVNGYNYVRPFIAEIEVDELRLRKPTVPGGHQSFVDAEDFDALEVKRVIPLDEWAREQYGDYGWIEQFFDPPEDNVGNTRRFKDYKYTGADAREMPEEDVRKLIDRRNAYLKSARGFTDEELPEPIAIGPTVTLKPDQTTSASGNSRRVYDWAMRKFGSEEVAKNFTEWFGDSKITEQYGHPDYENESGPLEVYHGSPSGMIEEFDFSLLGGNTGAATTGLGVFFTNDQEVAAGFSGKPKDDLSRVTSVYLRMENPLVFENEDPYSDAFYDLKNEIESHDSNYGWNRDPKVTSEAAKSYVESLRFRGYDGIIIKNTAIDAVQNGHAMFIVFSKEQIKSSEHNNGSFSLRSGSTRMSTWVKYKGPRGGEGWRNTATDEVRYQAEMPTGRDGDSQKTSFRVGDIEDADSVLNRVKSSPQHPSYLDWARYASRFGIEGDFRHVEVPMAEIAKMIQSGYLRMSESLDDAEIARRVSSGSRNPVIITNEPGRNSLVVDGTHSLTAAMQAGDASVKAIVPVNHVFADQSSRDVIPEWWNQPSENVYAKGMTNGEVTEDWLKRHRLTPDENGFYTMHHASPVGDLTELRAGSHLALSVKDAIHFASRDRDISEAEISVYEVKFKPWEIDGGQWAITRVPVSVKKLTGSGASASRSKVQEWAEKRFQDKEVANNFTEWFGDSQVVDEDGNPLVVYHGTDSDFNVFRPSRPPESHILPFGYHFTESADVAAKYGNVVMPVVLKSLKLYDATGLAVDEISKEIAGRKFKEGMHSIHALDAGGSGMYGARQAQLMLERYGYDGIVYIDPVKPEAGKSYVVFLPGQIKSATGNSGKFDPSSSAITMSTWVRHKGLRGGEGWRNTATDEIRYQDEMPEPRSKTAEPWQMTRQQFRESQPVWNHQTWEEFEKFDENAARAKFPRSANSPDRLGVWFTDQVGLYGPINLEAHANVKNPLVFSDKADTGATAFEQMQKAMDAAGGPDNYRHRLLSQGFDGVLLQNTRTDLKKDGSKRQNILIALDWNSPSILSRIADANEYEEGQSVPSAFDRHRAAVEQALAAGKAVPPEVLADYPELQSGEEKAVVTMSTWVKYTGPRGGQGWRNIQTDEVRYQSEMPKDQEPLAGFAKEVVEAIEQSGIPADYVRLLYSGFSSNSPLKAYQEDITVGLEGLSEDRGVTKKEIEQIKAYFKDRSVAAARKAGIEFPFTAYRGEEINDTKPIIAMTRQQRTAAFHASKSKHRVLRQQEITEDDVLFWAEAFPGTFSEDEWIVKRKSQLSAVGVGSIALQAHIEQWATDRFKDRQAAKNFVQWFGRSKIVNDYGVPQVYYHGTHRPGFREFKTDNPSDGVNKRETIAFSPDPDFASMYASENGGAVYPVFLKVENPADYRNDEHCKLLAKYRADYHREFLLTKANRAAWKVETDEALEQNVQKTYEKELKSARSGYWAAGWEDKQFLEKHGFDGSYVQENWDRPENTEPNLVVLHNSQIKSATGNSGDFRDPGNIAMSTWLKYEGPRGGRGWRNVETDEVRYQKDSPVDQLSTEEPQTFVRSFLELDDIEIENRLNAKKQKLSSAIYQKYMEASGNDQHDERLKLLNELRERVTLDLQFTKSMDSIPPDIAATFKATVESALKKITSPHAIAALGRNVETVEYRKNIAEISLAECRIKHRKMPDGDEKRDIEFRAMLNPTTVAFWTHNQLDAKHHGTLYLDGGELDQWEIEHVYLHEFGHAIDGHNKFSSAEQWKRVWQAEILMREFSADRISDYSTVDASEGFAEFFRFVCLMPSLAEEKFPRCFEFFAQNNLV